MNSQRKVLFIAVVLMFFSLGCETCRGAATGFKKDFQKLKEMDIWVNENMW